MRNAENKPTPLAYGYAENGLLHTELQWAQMDEAYFAKTIGADLVNFAYIDDGSLYAVILEVNSLCRSLTEKQTSVDDITRAVLEKCEPVLRRNLYFSIYLMSDYDVQWLPDGLQGVKWLQAGNTPDLIISDIRMPGMRGDDFLEWIKQNELFRHIPVIMLSSEDSTSERIRLLEIGAVDYIVKPFNPMELKIRVKKILPN